MVYVNIHAILWETSYIRVFSFLGWSCPLLGTKRDDLLPPEQTGLGSL